MTFFCLGFAGKKDGGNNSQKGKSVVNNTISSPENKGILKNKVLNTAGNHDGSNNSSPSRSMERRTCPTEARSSGSGESTPAGGTIISNSRTRADLKSSALTGDESRLNNNSRDNHNTNAMDNNVQTRKPSFRQLTMHLDKISSFEDEDEDGSCFPEMNNVSFACSCDV